MDSSKAKQAKSKAKARTAATKQKQQAQATPQGQQQADPIAAAHLAMLSQGVTSGAVTPEVQAQQIAMQDKTQTVNPYHAMGMKPNNYYNPGNVVGGGYVPGS